MARTNEGWMTHCPGLFLACPLGQLPSKAHASTSLDASFPRPPVHLGYNQKSFSEPGLFTRLSYKGPGGTPTPSLHRWTCPTPTSYLQVAARKDCCPQALIIQYALCTAADNWDLSSEPLLFAGRIKRLRSKVQSAQKLAGQEPKAT